MRSAAANALQAAKISPSVLLDLSSLLDERELCVTGTLQIGDTGAASNWQAQGAVDISGYGPTSCRTKDSSPYFEQESLHPNYWGQLA